MSTQGLDNGLQSLRLIEYMWEIGVIDLTIKKTGLYSKPMKIESRKQGYGVSKRSGDSSPRPRGRGFFLPSRWSFKNGKLSLKFYARTPNDQWRFRRSWIFQKFLKHGLKGENLTNNASSKTRHGSDAFCRHVRSIANPELCYDSFFYLLVSGFGGDANLFKAVRYESALPFILTPTLSRGISLASENVITKEVQ